MGEIISLEKHWNEKKKSFETTKTIEDYKDIKKISEFLDWMTKAAQDILSKLGADTVTMMEEEYRRGERMGKQRKIRREHHC